MLLFLSCWVIKVKESFITSFKFTVSKAPEDCLAKALRWSIILIIRPVCFSISFRSFVIFSFGKTYHTTGWKLGYCAAPENLTKELRKVHQFVVFSVNTPFQYAYADFLDNEEHYLNLNNFYQKKRDIVLNLLHGTEFNFSPANGTYFQLLDYSKISEMNDLEFAELLTKEFGIAVIPLSPFYSKLYNDKIIRICFAKRDEVLEEGMDRLKKAAEIILNNKSVTK